VRDRYISGAESGHHRSVQTDYVKTMSNVLLYGRENVHPLFDPNRFAPGIDYNGAIYDSAVLATRLINSPQGFQHDYCFFYGKNVPTNAPASFTRHTVDKAPRQYACNKAIGELDRTDIRYVEQQRNRLAERVRFEVNDLGQNMVACCEPQAPEKGVRGCASVIHIDRSVYDGVLDPNQSADDAIRAKFFLTCAMLHELAHAAHHYLFGREASEDFRENSNIAEAGFEFEARLFGQPPRFRLAAGNPDSRVYWGIWQSRNALPEFYSLETLARNAWQIPRACRAWFDGLDSIAKLFDDEFWEGEYVERGAIALIPEYIASRCLSGSNDIMVKSIPLSIKDLFREGGPSYAQRYARFANPEHELRGSSEVESRRMLTRNSG
jgi:hypothetical protein